MSTESDRLISLLQAKRRKDPKGFRKYLPDVADMLPEASRGSSLRSPSGLAKAERAFHQKGLQDSLRGLESGGLAPEQAAKGLHHYAMLIRDDALFNEVKDDDFKALVKAAIGKSPGTYRAKTTISVAKGGKVLEPISALRGVYLNLDGERRLVSVTIHPGKVREFGKLMKVVGIGADSESDVSARHDHYLTMQEPHGSTQ